MAKNDNEDLTFKSGRYVPCSWRDQQQQRRGEMSLRGKTEFSLQPVYNYCKYYKPTWNGKECQFDKEAPPVNCPDDADYTFAPFEMESSVATENNMVRKEFH